MKYFENNDQLGVMAADSKVTSMILENLGYSSLENEEAPNLVAIGDSIFGLSPELCALDENTLGIKLTELSDSLFESLGEEPELTESVEYDGEDYVFENVVQDDEGNYYLSLAPAAVEEEESEDFVMEFNGKSYDVVDEEEGDTFAYLVEGEDGEYSVVDTEEEAEFIVHLKAQAQE